MWLAQEFMEFEGTHMNMYVKIVVTYNHILYINNN